MEQERSQHLARWQQPNGSTDSEQLAQHDVPVRQNLAELLRRAPRGAVHSQRRLKLDLALEHLRQILYLRHQTRLRWNEFHNLTHHFGMIWEMLANIVHITGAQMIVDLDASTKVILMPALIIFNLHDLAHQRRIPRTEINRLRLVATVAGVIVLKHVAQMRQLLVRLDLARLQRSTRQDHEPHIRMQALFGQRRRNGTLRNRPEAFQKRRIHDTAKNLILFVLGARALLDKTSFGPGARNIACDQPCSDSSRKMLQLMRIRSQQGKAIAQEATKNDQQRFLNRRVPPGDYLVHALVVRQLRRSGIHIIRISRVHRAAKLFVVTSSVAQGVETLIFARIVLKKLTIVLERLTKRRVFAAEMQRQPHILEQFARMQSAQKPYVQRLQQSKQSGKLSWRNARFKAIGMHRQAHLDVFHLRAHHMIKRLRRHDECESCVKPCISCTK